MHRIIITILIIVNFSTIGYTQSINIEGVIKEVERKEALPYANIYLQKEFVGTVSNNRGEFKILIPQKKSNDTLIVSFIGYKPQAFLVSKIKNPLEVFLEENPRTLGEVVVQGSTVEAIIKKAIEKIPGNYRTNPFKFTGFYRVTSQKENSYIHLSEAVFDIYQSKLSRPNQQFKLEKMRAIKDEKASRGIDLGLKPSGIYEFDIVNSIDGIGLLNNRGLRQHTFEIEGTELINGREAYKISFDQKEIKQAGYKGYMLVDKENFAFVYFNFGLSPKGLKYHKFGDASLRALMKIVGINISMQKNNFQIQYNKIGNLYYLNNVGNDATLTFKSDREHYNFKTDTRVDYLVTKIETDDISPFTNNETLGQAKLVEEQYSKDDADFWKDYTIILPTNNFNEIAKTIEANNKANDIKLELEVIINKLPKDKITKIDSILSFYNRKKLFNGNALITYKGDTIFQKSFNNELTNNKQGSQFRIGSLSKTFTAMVIAQLENESKLSYSDSVHKFLANYPNGKITIGQLLSHQSGIPNYLANQVYITDLLTHKYSIEEVVAKFCSDSLEFEPGSKFSYSNSNYTVLSLIVEKVTGKDFKDVLYEYVFEPLNMVNTYYGESTDDSNLVTAFHFGKPEPKYNVQNVGGAGGITSTTSDLLRWSNALETEQLLTQEKIGRLFKPEAEYTDWDAYYGYGWMVDKHMFSVSKKHKILYHPGTDFGFYSMFVKQPDNGITIVLLNNTGEFPRFEITELVLNELN
jgi:CubicO group peptidase (beta-lactamase class C family)